MFQVDDKAHNRVKYAGRGKAVVVDNRDPQQNGRIKVTHPILGDTGWIPYLQTGMMFDFPEKGDIVYVEADGGFEEYPVAWGKAISESSSTPLNTKFKRNIPTNRGFYTPGGHTFEVDDGESDGLVSLAGNTKVGQGMRLTSINGNIIKIADEDNSVHMSASSGQLMKLGQDIGFYAQSNTSVSLLMANGVGTWKAKGTSIVIDDFGTNIEDAAGNYFSMSEVGIQLEDYNGNTILMDSEGTTIEDNQGNKIALGAGGIEGTTGTGATFTCSAQEASAFNTDGAGFKALGASIAIGGPSAELVDIVTQLLETLSTDTFAGFGAPAGQAAKYAELATKLATIKGSL